MGKTADGAIWLDEDLTDPYDFWQFWRNTDDQDVIRFLKLFTDISMGEINKLSKLKGEEINEAKKILANELTKNTHGEEISEKVYNSALETFEKKVISGNLPVKILNSSSFFLFPLSIASDTIISVYRRTFLLINLKKYLS